ncbi:deoxynucleoside kinase [Panacagrimonas sp.]|uniref:deoxynucleoside kinase n=1 Tax=Panacagrimonas sp. TaxID=2480088 RepID=UPI003B51BC2D
MKPSYIVVEGVIGAGKTTVARKLAAALDATLLLEQPDDNPFLARFYRDPGSAAFSTQLTFLLQRAGQVERLQQRDLFSGHCVADFMFEKDRLFAGLTLNSSDFALYAQVFERLAFELPRPDRIVYLTAPLDVLMARIARRGRDYEIPLQAEYLERLAQAYARWLRDGPGAPLVEVDTAEYDLVGNPDDFSELLAALDSAETLVRLTRGALI